MKHSIHDIANALDARPNGLGGYNAYCPVCQTTPQEQRKGRKLGVSVGRTQPVIYNCFRGCRYEDIKDHIDDLMKLTGYIDDKPRIFTANVHTANEEDLIRKEAVQCVMENAFHGHDSPEVMNYAEQFGLTNAPHNWYFSPKILGSEGLNIPEPHRQSVVVVCRERKGENLPIGGQRILINSDGSRATNRAGAKFNKFTFGFIRGNPYRSAMLGNCMTKALLVTESAETAAVLYEATNGSEVWSTFGANNFKTIPLTDPPIPRTRPVIFFPDKDEYGSRAHVAVQEAMDYHRLNGYRVFELHPPEPEGSKNNFADSCKRLGLEYCRNYIKSTVDEIKAYRDETRVYGASRS